MIIQYIFILLLTGLSAWYIVRKFREQLQAGSCETGCGKCAAAKTFNSLGGPKIPNS